jgi:hypothetical protein
MSSRRTLEQNYRTTIRSKKRMKIFTTNWYLCKTQPSSNAIKTNAHNSTTPKNNPTTNNQTQTTFETQLLEAIDEGLTLLGESSKQCIYFHLENTFKINKQEIPYKIEEFTNAIEKIFGNAANVIQIQIMKCLYKKVGPIMKQHPKQKQLKFTGYINALKKAQNKPENSTNPNQNSKQGKKGGNSAGLSNGHKNSLNGIFGTFSSIGLL